MAVEILIGVPIVEDFALVVGRVVEPVIEANHAVAEPVRSDREFGRHAPRDVALGVLPIRVGADRGEVRSAGGDIVTAQQPRDEIVEHDPLVRTFATGTM